MDKKFRDKARSKSRTPRSRSGSGSNRKKTSSVDSVQTAVSGDERKQPSKDRTFKSKRRKPQTAKVEVSPSKNQKPQQVNGEKAVPKAKVSPSSSDKPKGEGRPKRNFPNRRKPKSNGSEKKS